MVVAIIICALIVAYLISSAFSWISLKSKYESISNLVMHYANKTSGQVWFQNSDYSIREEPSYSCSRNPDDMCSKSACHGCCYAHRIVTVSLVFPGLKSFLSGVKPSSFFIVNHIVRDRVRVEILSRLSINTDIKKIVKE